MINIIIGDNNKSAQEIKHIIDNYMMNYDIEVKYHLFENYNDFKENVKDICGYKLFILKNDYEEVGLKEASYIRNKLDNWNSIIILTTQHNESKYEVSEKRLFIFDYISKNHFFKKTLKEDLDHLKSYYINRPACLTIETNRVIKIIDFYSIESITKEKDSKKCIIKTSDMDYYVNETLLNISKRLDRRFVKINRSCIINIDRITEYDVRKNKITLKSGVVSFDISREYKKNLINKIINDN